MISAPKLNPLIIFSYVFQLPFGGDGWIISVNNLEDLVGGHICLGLLCVGVGVGIWHILTKSCTWARLNLYGMVKHIFFTALLRLVLWV